MPIIPSMQCLHATCTLRAVGVRTFSEPGGAYRLQLAPETYRNLAATGETPRAAAALLADRLEQLAVLVRAAVTGGGGLVIAGVEDDLPFATCDMGAEPSAVARSIRGAV